MRMGVASFYPKYTRSVPKNLSARAPDDGYDARAPEEAYILSTALLLSAFALTFPTASGISDAPDKLITAHGVEIRNDERVFVLFAALNGLGFSEETQRKGPPLRAPVFHPLRAQIRDALRKA